MDVSKSRAMYTCKIINERSHTALHKGAWQFSNRSKQSTALIRNNTVTYSLINKTRLMHTVQHWGNPDQYIYNEVYTSLLHHAQLSYCISFSKHFYATKSAPSFLVAQTRPTILPFHTWVLYPALHWFKPIVLNLFAGSILIVRKVVFVPNLSVFLIQYVMILFMR